MPTYDYECQACQHRFETFQSIKDDPLKKCPSCEKLKLIRLLSGGLNVVIVRSSNSINIPGAHAEQWKKDRHVKEMRALVQEPMTESEQVAAYEQGREWERARGLDKGHVSGGRKPLVGRGENKDAPEIKKRVSVWKDRARKKIVQSMESRRRVVR